MWPYLNNLYNHFKNIYQLDQSEDGAIPTYFANNETAHSLNEQINHPITESEIPEAKNALRNDMLSGIGTI